MKKKDKKIATIIAMAALIGIIVLCLVCCRSGGGEGTDPSETTSVTEPSEATVGTTEATEGTTEPTEGSTAGTKPTEGTEPTTKPTELEETTPKPTEPKETEPKPTEPKPTEPKPTEPKPTEPKPTEPPVTEPKPTEPKPTEPVHTHSYSSKVTTAATCTANGVKTYSCSCGDSYTESIPATGHSYSVTSETAGTCTSEGSKVYTCSNCGDSYSDGTGRADHSWVHHHTDEVGHEEWYYVCHCGGWTYNCELANAKPSAWAESWSEHMAQVKAETGTTAGHSYYESSVWVVDTPASDKWVCSGCGAETTTQP